MAFGVNYNELNPIFDEKQGGGVYNYYRIGVLGAKVNSTYAASVPMDMGLELAGSDEYRFYLPFRAAICTCIAHAISSALGVKAGAATAESVIGIAVGKSADWTFNTAEDGTEICLITCDATGDLCKIWKGATTRTEIEAFTPIFVWTKVAAVSDAAAANAYGAAVVDVWYQQLDGFE